MSEFNPKLKNFVIRYESWEAYNAESEEEAIRMFEQDGHSQEEIIGVEG